VTARSAAAALGALLAPLPVLAGGAAAASWPSPAERIGIVAALRGQQGEVAIDRIRVSSTSADYASIDWGFSTNGYSALNNTCSGAPTGRGGSCGHTSASSAPTGPATTSRPRSRTSCCV
jgi:hypothetical protein